MDILGINIPAWSAAMGLIVTAFLTGIGIGLGSEIGKYLVNKYVTHKIDKLDQGIRKLSLKEYIKQKIGGTNKMIGKLSIDIEKQMTGQYQLTVVKPKTTVMGIKVGNNVPDENRLFKNKDELMEWIEDNI